MQDLIDQVLNERIDGGTVRKVLPRINPVVLQNAATGSFNAAERLHHELLPGWDYQITNESHAVVSVYQDQKESTASDPITARAWLLAILEARNTFFSPTVYEVVRPYTITGEFAKDLVKRLHETFDIKWKGECGDDR